ncbi:hypothetical protein AVEN_225379-1 [Araneus ventricosus]|uniref:Uncharacterized protein n=1 Tax=Araneus ventricosus TaxID=182803 RepID=A0A4Y2MHR4_ARAVE|nr:hypothetical protein AVEN_225379-1 [Araneus ventricosus]
MFLNSPASLLIKVQLTALGLTACFYTFSKGSDIFSRRMMKLLSDSRDRSSVQNFYRRLLFKATLSTSRQNGRQVCRKIEEEDARKTTLQLCGNLPQRRKIIFMKQTSCLEINEILRKRENYLNKIIKIFIHEENRTPSVTPVPVTRPVTERFDGQDTGILFKKNKINKKKEIYTLCTAQAFSFYTISS